MLTSTEKPTTSKANLQDKAHSTPRKVNPSSFPCDISPQYGIITVMIPAVSSGATWTLYLYQWPACNWVWEVYLCRQYLPDKATTGVCRTGMLPFSRHGAYGCILLLLVT